MNKIKEYIETMNTINEHLESFNKTFQIKTKIVCLECGTTKKGENSTVNPNENNWWICEECEEEVEAKLECFNNDVNYNLSNSY